jgi:hypothetical protein
MGSRDRRAKLLLVSDKDTSLPVLLKIPREGLEACLASVQP